MQSGNDLDEIRFNKKIDRERKTSQQRSTHVGLDLRELKWRLSNPREDQIYFIQEFAA